MAKKICNLNLDEETINELDEFAEKVGMSRSAAANMVMKSALAGDPSAVLVTVAKTLKQKSGKRAKQKGSTAAAV